MLIVVHATPVLVSEPYKAGHQLTESEAKALNRLRSQLIAKQTQRTADPGMLSADEITQVALELDDSFEFHTRDDAPSEFEEAYEVGKRRQPDADKHTLHSRARERLRVRVEAAKAALADLTQ